MPSYQVIRAQAAQVMGNQVVVAMLEAEREAAIKRLTMARELPEIYRAQAEVALYDKFLNDIESVKK